MKNHILCISLVGLSTMLSAYAAPINVVATVGMVADVVREIGQDEVTVTTLIGEGVDPHVYKPTRHDVLSLMRAEMVFYNGLLLEGKMAETLEKLKRQDKPVVAVAERITESVLLSDQSTRHHDPHVWMDPGLWSSSIDAISDALVAFRPETANMVRLRSDAYRRRVQELDEYVRTIMVTIPRDRRVMITAHDAFHYFGRAYDIEVQGIQGLSTESEAGLNDINRLVDLIVSRGIKAIFVETSVADKNVKALIEGAKARGHHVVIGGSLFSDAMGAAGTYEGTYIGMIEHNANTVVAALGGQVPEGGLAGWLKGKAP